MRRPCCTTLPPSPRRLLVLLAWPWSDSFSVASAGVCAFISMDPRALPWGILQWQMMASKRNLKLHVCRIVLVVARASRHRPRGPQPRLRCLPGAAYEASGARARSTRPDREQERVGTGQIPSACAPRCAVLRCAAVRERPPAEDGAHEGPADGRRARPPRRPVLTRCGSECVACWPVRCGLLRGPVFRRRGVRCARMGSAACGGS